MGIESETERFWRILGDRDALLSGKYEDDVDVSSGSKVTGGADELEKEAIDATVVVTADHGHVTVHPQDMITLPECILELLEYACIGVHGKGRHAYRQSVVLSTSLKLGCYPTQLYHGRDPSGRVLVYL